MVTKLLGSVREYKKQSILSPIFITLEVLMEVFIPFMMAILIDEGINKGNMQVVWQVGFVLVVAALFSLAFGVIAGRNAAVASVGFGANLRKDMFYQVQKFSFSNIDRFKTSSLVTRLTTDITNVQNAFQMVIRIAVRAPMMLIFSLIMAFRVNWELSMIFLVAIPLLGGGLFLIISNVHPIFMKVFKTYDKLNRVVQENLRGIRIVKAYVREDYEKEKFESVSKSIYNDFTKAEKILAFNMPLMQFCIYTCILLISWFGANFIVVDKMTTGEMVSLIAYASQILMSLMMLSMVFVMVIISRASSERIVEVISEKSDIAEAKDTIKEVRNGNISFENVDFSYAKDGRNPCLKNICLEIRSGQTVGIIGGTGSSKSTLVQLISRLYDVTSGKLKVGDVDVRDYDIKVLRNQVSVVLQKNVLFSGTIKENLRWGNENATDEEMIEACKLAMAHDFITEMKDGYNTYIEQGGSNVSGGQKQRICIARAILKNPKILILDDSTSAVDTKTDAIIKRGFKKMLKDTTKIVIAQRVSSIKDADFIVVMDNGKITKVGTHDELLVNSKIYKEVFQSQLKGGLNDA